MKTGNRLILIPSFGSSDPIIFRFSLEQVEHCAELVYRFYCNMVTNTARSFFELVSDTAEMNEADSYEREQNS